MFKWIRIAVLIYTAGMLAAIEYVGISTEGKVELESDRRDVYAAILFVTASSFITQKNTTTHKRTTND